MSNRRAGIGYFKFIIAARMIASLIAAIGIVLAVFFILIGSYWQAAVGLALFLLFAFWAQTLIRDLEPGLVRLPGGQVHRKTQPGTFWILFCLFCLMVPAALTAIASFLYNS